MQGLKGSLFLVLAVFGLLLLQSVFARALAPHPFAPYLGFPIALALGVAHGVRLLRGASTAFAIGVLYDSFTGNPLGIHAFAFVVGFLAAWLVGYLTSFRGPPFEIVVTFVLTLALGGLIELIRGFVPGGMSWSGIALALALFGSSLTTALLAPVLFALARVLDPSVEQAPA